MDYNKKENLFLWFYDIYTCYFNKILSIKSNDYSSTIQKLILKPLPNMVIKYKAEG